MRVLSLLALVGLTACGLSEDKYNDKASELLCDKSTECDDGFSELFCGTEEGTATATDDGGCEFDSKAAKSCLDSVDAAGCDDYLKKAAEGDCLKVYVCGGEDTTSGSD